MTRLAAILLLLVPAIGSAQILPNPSAENPRIQSIQWAPSQEVILTTLPKTGLTVMLEPGEQIRRVSVDDENRLEIRVSHERDSFLVLPLTEEQSSALLVQTDRRDYRFSVQSGAGLTAAYLVKFDFGQSTPPTAEQPAMPTGESWSYRVRGDRSVRPASIQDDGVRTQIRFAADQALPAVFSIGPTGKEQVVNGYMRGSVFEIDRVHAELVFRIDKDKATARRSRSPEKNDG